MTPKQQYQTKKKTQHNTPKQPQTDLFTAICKADLGVECVKEYKFHPQRRWRFDYAMPSKLIAVEVEGGVWTGGRHISSVGFLKDMEKYNTAALMGWRVFRTIPKELYSSNFFSLLEDATHNNLLPL